MPKRLRAAILLGAFSGLRTSEAFGLGIADVDFMRGLLWPDRDESTRAAADAVISAKFSPQSRSKASAPRLTPSITLSTVKWWPMTARPGRTGLAARRSARATGS